ncbi:hypothetical protein GFY24_14400 [Nocardia sp. SYP-A9097]|uniref:hypothetical protein n=1 Tax=Nocardia sp. SYP-A9097 TaxID=2663237 RepID=UPI00129ACDFC|nr:hypothetical protein [Nocardia sp. SYP-A9097]MRH88619.1 hypothetical protein [Nocardia sp. SYP-A9097]
MAGKLHADARLVGEASGTAADIRDRLAGIADAARTAVSAGQSAWGDDEFGAKFAEGAKGFASGSENMADGTGNLSTSFGNLVTGLQKSAKALGAMEHRNTDSFK